MHDNDAKQKPNSAPGTTSTITTTTTNKQAATKRPDVPLPKGDWKVVLDEEQIARSVARMSYEIVERDRNLKKLVLVGIRTGGEFLARRIQARISEIEGVEPPFGVVDITLYRDDILETDSLPTLKGTDLPFSVSGSRIVLVDDVLFTGRTVRSALDAIIDFGRPRRVELAVLVDRGHREYPIRPDYVGKNLPTSYADSVRVRLKEGGHNTEAVYLIEGDRARVAHERNLELDASGAVVEAEAIKK